ncbi:hypothetical protein RclHR1_02140002 [Rhizophagus clarus]|uniref:BTB domain-containing protein n=1 Tax=Rhizophagus clarus TaxID=94130 RepID=A0A2Z6R5X3_9GLOM|nr:hypothetical protein RclHR1_02140002 [Rhizophagus clarus]
MSYEFCQEVANDYEKVFESDEEYDVIIYAGENMKELNAHLFVLRTRSLYFRTGFSKKWAEKKDGKFIFKKPNISHEIFEIILRYFVYLLRKEYLIKHDHEFLQQQCSVEILETIYQHESFTELWNFCLKKICEEPEILFNSNRFINLSERLLEFILKQDDLNLDEILIWDGLIKWCLAQHLDISRDIKKWDKDEVTILKKTIQRFIPLIRFYDISLEDFKLKVFPYKVLLPVNLINDILTFHSIRKDNVSNKELNIIVLSPRKSKCIYDSILIKPQHFAIFSSWIGKKIDNYNTRNIPYNFNLLYRSSRDGKTAKEFHTKCDNKGATIVIAKFYIHTFRSSKSSNSKSYSNGDPKSIQNYSVHGPVFGSSDLYENNGSSWFSNPSSYPKIDDMPIGKFYVDDYEVFQVIKKS